MEERIDAALKETVASRREVAKGAAAGGLAALFAAVATGGVLASETSGFDDSGDFDGSNGSDDLNSSPKNRSDLNSSPNGADLGGSLDTAPGHPDQAGTTPDGGEATNDSAVKGISKKRRKRRRG